jgi:hypothetical protein
LVAPLLLLIGCAPDKITGPEKVQNLLEDCSPFKEFKGDRELEVRFRITGFDGWHFRYVSFLKLHQPHRADVTVPYALSPDGQKLSMKFDGAASNFSIAALPNDGCALLHGTPHQFDLVGSWFGQRGTADDSEADPSDNYQ